MQNFRDIKRKARGDVHAHMRIPAYYLASESADPIECTVRLHTATRAFGGMQGTNFGYAEREEFTPSVILWRAEIAQPVRNAIISVDAGEAYRIDYIFPPDDVTIKASITPLSSNDAEDLPYPGSA